MAVAITDRSESRAVARVAACALLGLETAIVTVEADVANGLPSFTVVGLTDHAIQEARERVRAAIRNSGFAFPLRRVTVNLAPAERKKEGTGFDLAIALAILRASGQLSRDPDALCLGELGLDGALRPIRGVMPRARRAVDDGMAAMLLARENAAEAAALGVEAYGFRDLRTVVAHVEGRTRAAPTAPPPEPAPPEWPVDLGDVVGQETPKRALEIAAAGGHSLLLIGPPGTGKTLLARALPSIMPPLESDELLVASSIHSVAGLLDPDRPLLAARPFRAPHHTASPLSLVGGGTPPRPGEVSLAHAGALFLDEMLEFSSYVLQTLREPLGEGQVTISRAGAAMTYPARFTLVGALNPCPCGHLGDEERECTCLPEAILRYRSRLSPPLLDRIDMRVNVPRVPYETLRAGTARERSREVAARVRAARERVRARIGGTGRWTNADLTVPEVRTWCGVDGDADALLSLAVSSRRLSARACHRLLRLARTIADLEGAERIRAEDVSLALLLRANA